MKAPFRLILIILAALLFLIAGLGASFGPENWPWHGRLVAWGLFCWVASELVS